MPGLTLVLGQDAEFMVYETAKPTLDPWRFQMLYVSDQYVTLNNEYDDTMTHIRLGSSKDIGRGVIASFQKRDGQRSARLNFVAPSGIGIDRMSVYRQRFKT